MITIPSVPVLISNPSPFTHLAQAFGVMFTDNARYLHALATPGYNAKNTARRARLAYCGRATLKERVAWHLSGHNSTPLPVLMAIAREVSKDGPLALISAKIGLPRALHASADDHRRITENTLAGRSILADTLCALIAVVCIEHGCDGPNAFLRRFIFPSCDILLHRASTRCVDANGTWIFYPAWHDESPFRPNNAAESTSDFAVCRSLSWLDL